MQGLAPVDPVPQEIALFLDVDGTLLDLAPHPDAVSVPPLLRPVLTAVRDRLGGAVALVSGRPIEALDRLFAPVRLAAAGVHGAEIRDRPEDMARPTSRPLPECAWPALMRLLDRFPGSFAENKGASFAVHYRLADAAAAELHAALDRFRQEFTEPEVELTSGHRVFELRVAGFDKGRAILSFLAQAPFVGRRPVFIADDEMDRPGFQAVLARGGSAYSVGAALPGLSGWFRQPADLRAWLERLACR